MKNQTILCFLIGFLTLSSCNTHYYVVRHAEKASSAPNTPLSNDGFMRAEALWSELEDKGINRIYVSNYIRTQQTAQPTADATGITPQIFQAPGEMDQLIQQLKSQGNKKKVLVVSHSNLVPIIVDSLMKSPQGITIPESDFDNLFHIHVHKGLGVRRTLYQLTYGQPTS